MTRRAFNLSEWTPKRKVTSTSGREADIVSTDQPGLYCVLVRFLGPRKDEVRFRRYDRAGVAEDRRPGYRARLYFEAEESEEQVRYAAVLRSPDKPHHKGVYGSTQYRTKQQVRAVHGDVTIAEIRWTDTPSPARAKRATPLET